MGDIGEYVDNDGGGKVGWVRCCEGVVDWFINICFKIFLFEVVDVVEEVCDRFGCNGIGVKRGIFFVFEYIFLFILYFGVLIFLFFIVWVWVVVVW